MNRKSDHQLTLELGQAAAEHQITQLTEQAVHYRQQATGVRTEIRDDILARQARSISAAIEESYAVTDADMQERIERLDADFDKRVGELSEKLDAMPRRAPNRNQAMTIANEMAILQRDKTRAELEHKAKKLSILMAEEEARHSPENRERWAATMRLGHLSEALDAVPDKDLAALATCFAAVPGSRAEFEEALLTYSDPSSRLSHIGNIGTLIHAFVAQTGGPFSQGEIDRLRQEQREREALARSVQNTIELHERAQAAQLRYLKLQEAVEKGTPLEQLNIDVPVPE